MKKKETIAIENQAKMNDFQYEILDRAGVVKSLIDGLELNNDSLKKNILKH